MRAFAGKTTKTTLVILGFISLNAGYELPDVYSKILDSRFKSIWNRLQVSARMGTYVF